jgi:mRNA-degrading endonuclease RelE of RelBE toxin-antitoxin system
MGKYRLRLKKSAAKEIENLPRKDCARVVGAIQKLLDDPYGQNTQKLSGAGKVPNTGGELSGTVRNHKRRTRCHGGKSRAPKRCLPKIRVKKVKFFSR